MQREKKYIVGLLAVFFTATLILTHSRPHSQTRSPQRIAVLIMATGGYVDLAQRLIASARTHFCPNHYVTYFVFTDRSLPPALDVIKVHQEQMGWPYDTMMRFGTYYKNRELFTDFDYLFACDADMLFAGPVGDEILGTRLATVHPQVRFRRGPYETNPLSTACVGRHEGNHYFAGAFYGGTQDEFITLVRVCQENVDIDLARGHIAYINDESHLNRYFIDFPPTIILPPAYCHFESWRSPYCPKLVAFDNPNHDKGGRRKNNKISPLEYYKRYLHELVEKK